MATREQLINAVDARGFDVLKILHLFEGGSALHGARLEEKSDLDICGIFVEPKANLYGMSPWDHFVTSTSDGDQRNTTEDVDITLYSLKRWAWLACKGNPTALSYLFAENVCRVDWDCMDVSIWGDHVEQLKSAIIAKSAAGHFCGFVTGQMKRLLGEKGLGKHGQRPELTFQHGYDTKAAMHALRLCAEGIDLMVSGEIVYPRPEKDLLTRVRKGEWSLVMVESTVHQLLNDLEIAREGSQLREKPDYARVNEILVDMYQEFYS